MSDNAAHPQLQRMLRLARTAAWDWNFETKEFNRSELHDQLFGHPEGITHWDIDTFEKLVHPDDFASLTDRLKGTSNKNGEMDAEFRVIWPDGSIHWLWSRAMITDWRNNNPVRMSGVTIDITAQKQAEQEALESRQRLEKAQEIAKLGHGEFNHKTGSFFWSDRIYQLFGLDPDDFELTVENFFKLLPEAERGQYKRLFDKARRDGISFDHIFQLNKPDGEIGFFRERAEFIKDKKGEVEKVTGIILDVTEQEKSKRELEKYRSQLEKAQDLARIGYWEFNYNDGLLIWSETVYEMFGLNPQTFHPTFESFRNLVHPEDRVNLDIAQKRVLENGQLFESEYRLIRPDGNIGYFQERGELIVDEKGNPVKLTGAVIDITDLKKTESQLLESEQTYRLLFHHNPLPGLIYDVDTLKIMQVNKAAVKCYGYSEDEFLNMTIDDLHIREDLPRLHQVVQRVNRHFSNSGEWNHITKNGSKIIVEIISTGIQYGGKKCRRVIINDITEHKKKEQEHIISIIEGEDRERKRIAMDLHDSLAQYLTAATMNFSSVKSQIALLPANKQKQFATGLSHLKDALHETRDIAQNLMPKAIEDFGLVPALQSLFQKIEQTHNVSIDFHHDISRQNLKHQVEINLYRITQEALSNSLKHSDATRIEVHIYKRSEFIEYKYSDNGGGFVGKREGSVSGGLGLSNMRMRAQSMSASFHIDGSQGTTGTIITSKIPILM